MYIYVYTYVSIYIYSNTILEREPRPQRTTTCPMRLRPYSVTLLILYPNTMKVK